MEEKKELPIPYLKKAIQVFKISGGLLVAPIIIIVFLRGRTMSHDLFDLIVTLPLVFVYFTVPLGLYYIWRSWKNKERSTITRFRYFLGYIFFAILLTAIALVVTNDLNQL